MRKIWIFLVKMSGWRLDAVDVSERPEVLHCVVAVAPHTSAADFLLGPAMLFKAGARPRIFIKKEFFNIFTRRFLRHVGAVEVNRGCRHNHLVDKAVEILKNEQNACIVITPEGTRKSVRRFHRGFYEIAQRAGVPIVLGYIDYKDKRMGYGPTIYPTGDFDADVKKMTDFFAPIHARHPEGWYWGTAHSDKQHTGK